MFATVAVVIVGVDDDFYLLALSRALQLKLIFKYIFIHFVYIVAVYAGASVCKCVFFFVYKTIVNFSSLVYFM